MEKIVFMFPGVGSQYVGMGKGFYENFKVFKETVDEAGDVLGQNLAKMCFLDADKDELSRLENAQLTVLTLSVGIFRVYMKEIGIKPDCCMGHSLGEYSALCCSGVIRFADALELVRQRGSIIGEVSSSLEGTMMWVVNLDRGKVEAICNDVCEAGKEVYISAYDAPTQTSMSGHTDAVMTAAKQMEKAGAIVYPLKMSGPFHSPLMEEASQRMRSTLRQYTYEDPLYPVLANRNAQLYQGKESVIDNLSLQLISPIRWKDSLDYLAAQGVTTAIEMGPKDVLKFLVKKNSDEIQPFTMDNEADLNKLKEKYLVREDEYLGLIGKCLGVAVSTKNRNHDNDVYEREVVKPYMRVAALYEQWETGGKSPTVNQVEDALKTLRSILLAKKVPEQEQQLRFNKILGSRIIRPEAVGS